MLAKGTQLQLSATGISPDGTSGDLTSEVTWSSSDVRGATLVAAGRVSGLTEGTTTELA